MVWSGDTVTRTFLTVLPTDTDHKYRKALLTACRCARPRCLIT